MTRDTNITTSSRSAGLAELVWRPVAGGPPAALGVVPLVLAGAPAVALPWAYEQQAREVAAASVAALVLTDRRLSGPDWAPLAATGRMRLVEDADGELFAEHLLDQELRKHPPSRALMDSFLLRRENWWYLPRLVLVLEPGAVEPVAPREGPSHALLAVDDGALHLATVTVADWDGSPLELDRAPEVSGPATLVGQEVSVPDAERWTVHATTGRYEQGRLHVSHSPPTRALEPVPSLRARMRRQRELERACTRALRSAGRR